MAKLEHFAIYADDTTALADFYCSRMEMKVLVKTDDSPPAYFLGDEAGMALEIIGRPPGFVPVDQRFVCHLAFWVDDFDAAISKLQAKGVRFELEPTDGREQRRIIFFDDPAGNRCQLVWRAKRLGS